MFPGEVKPGLPALSPPPFSATVGNHTYSFMEMASTLGSAIFVVPLLSILENIALAKVFCECLFLGLFIYYVQDDLEGSELGLLFLTWWWEVSTLILNHKNKPQFVYDTFFLHNFGR